MSTMWIIANGTFGEAMRRRILNVFLFVALALIVMGFAFATFKPAQELVIIKSLGLGVIQLAGVFISVILGINLLPMEIERRTIYTILSKPVHRWEFIFGKFLGGFLTVLTNVVLMALAFLVLLTVKEHGINLSVVKGVIMIVFQLLIVCAMAVTLSVFLTPFVNFFLSFGLFFLGSISSVWLPFTQNDAKRNILVTYMFKVLHFVVPNYENFNIQNPIINPNVQIPNETVYIAQSIGTAILYTVIYLLVAAFFFETREV